MGHSKGGGARHKTHRYLDIDNISNQGNKIMSSLDDYLNLLPDENAKEEDLVFEEEFVSLDTWLYEPEYMNLDIRLSEIQYDVLLNMTDFDLKTNKFTEGVCEWGKGGGKDFVSALAALRCVYWLLCLRNPYKYYGLARGTGIQLVNVAYTKEQAEHVYLHQLKGIVRNSPWFSKREPNMTRTRVYFDKEITLVSAAADGDSAEGQNIIFAVMDEAAAFKDAKTVNAQKRADGVKIQNAADIIYDVLRSSVNSRFPNIGKVLIISYPRYKDDYIQTKLSENKEFKRGYTSGPYATWEVNPSRKKEDFADDYEKDPEGAKSRYECDPPYSLDSWVKYPYRFLECVAQSAKIPGLVCPINELEVYDPFFQGIPGKYYVIHVDLALKKDRCAMALATQGNPVTREKCPCNYNNLPRVSSCAMCGLEIEKWIKKELPTMQVVLLKHFKPTDIQGGNKEVDFSDVRQEIFFIRDRGFKIYSLTYDGWQSRDSIQVMQKTFGKRKLKDRWGKEIGEQDIATTLSVDRDTKAYDTLKEFIYDGRFFITPPRDVKQKEDWEDSLDPVAIAYREFRALRLINGKKVDHCLGGSKDFTDSLAGCAFAIAQMPIIKDRRPGILGWQETVGSNR